MRRQLGCLVASAASSFVRKEVFFKEDSRNHKRQFHFESDLTCFAIKMKTCFEYKLIIANRSWGKFLFDFWIHRNLSQYQSWKWFRQWNIGSLDPDRQDIKRNWLEEVRKSVSVHHVTWNTDKNESFRLKLLKREEIVKSWKWFMHTHTHITYRYNLYLVLRHKQLASN